MDVEDLSIFWCLFQFLFYVLFKVFTLEVFHFLVWFTSIFSFQSYWEWIPPPPDFLFNMFLVGMQKSFWLLELGLGHAALLKV